MQSRDYAYAYHQAPPCELPDDGWKRVEIHDSAGFYPVAKGVESAMKALDFPRKDSFAVGLVLREAVVNALRHGHRGDTTRAVLIGYHLSARAAFIEVADEGPGFNPYLVPDLFDDDGRGEGGRGRGLLLMRLYTNWIRFNKRGNRVILCKRRSDP
jgi:anti-sigma regulatory factor (Ser/Thr protein kinase)